MNRVIIVGGGIAGASCALELHLYGIESVVIEEGKIGGVLNEAYEIENLPIYKSPVWGRDICRTIEERLKSAGVEIINDKCTKIRIEGKLKYVQTGGKKEIASGRLVIATGSKPKRILELTKNIKTEKIHFSPGNIKENKGNAVLVYGGGDTAFDYSLTLKKKGFLPTIMYRSKVKANFRLIEKVFNMKIPIIKGTIERICEIENALNIISDKNEERKTDYLLLAIGRVERIEFKEILYYPKRFSEKHIQGVESC